MWDEISHFSQQDNKKLKEKLELTSQEVDIYSFLENRYLEL